MKQESIVDGAIDLVILIVLDGHSIHDTFWQEPIRDDLVQELVKSFLHELDVIPRNRIRYSRDG